MGARGQRTQQRILDAAVRVFGEEGYHRCSIDRITKVSGCSRVSFYQYFASKEDVYRHLAAQVVEQLTASIEALDPITGDDAGWQALRAWVTRYAEIHRAFEPVFHAYQTAVESDDVLREISVQTAERTIGMIHSRLVYPALPSEQVDPVLRVVLECMNHTLDVIGILRSAAPDAYPSERIEVALADVMHRTFFGLHASVNAHAASGTAPPGLELSGTIVDWLQEDEASLEPNGSGNRALVALLDSGRDVFVSRGYYNTRVDDLASAAGVSHGAFYRYFPNKGQLARVLTARAIRTLGTALLDLPTVISSNGPDGHAALRGWVQKYHDAHTSEAAMLRVWIDAVLQDHSLRAEYAPPLDWGRRRMSRALQPRGFGDPDFDAIVLVALLGVIGVRPRPAAEVEASATIVERGLLGRV